MEFKEEGTPWVVKRECKNWRDLPGIRKLEAKVVRIDIKKRKLDLLYLKSCLMRHFVL